MVRGSSNHYYANSMNYASKRRKISKGNVIKYLIPGLQNEIDIPFPDRKLPVCKKCKKIYKTRELCRVRDCHDDLPWNTTYICVTLDDSCFTRNSKGDLRLVDEDTMQFVACSLPGPPMPYRAKKGHIGGAEAPICMSCREKNYTRHHCREKQKHQQLPWGTVYVLLSATPCMSGNGFQSNNGHNNHDAGPKRPASEISTSSSCSSGQDDGSVLKSMKDEEYSSTTIDTTVSKEEEVVVSDDIHKIESTCAFLVTIDKDHSCVLRWLEHDPCLPRSEYGSSWGSQSENIDHRSMYQHTSQFRSDTYPPPPPGWSGFIGSKHNGEQYCTPEWNGSMRGGPPKIPPSNHIKEFNGPPSQPSFNHYEQHGSHFSGMRPSMSYESNSHRGRGSHPMYSENENFTRGRSDMMYHPMSKSTYLQHQHEDFNRNHQSQLDPINSGLHTKKQYSNPEHGGPSQPYSLPPQSGQFHYLSECVPYARTSQGHHIPSFTQNSRYKNYSNSQGETWNSVEHPLHLGPTPTNAVPPMISR